MQILSLLHSWFHLYFKWFVYWFLFNLFFFHWLFINYSMGTSESTSVLSFFSFDVFIFVSILSSLSLLSLLCEIIYQFFSKLLCTEIHCIISTSNLWQNPPLYCYPPCLYHLNFSIYFNSSFSFLTYSLSQDILFC